MKTKYTDIYSCKENDAELRVLTNEDNGGKSATEPQAIDEIWVRIQGESGWTVVGINDLRAAMEAKGFRVDLGQMVDADGWIRDINTVNFKENEGREFEVKMDFPVGYIQRGRVSKWGTRPVSVKIDDGTPWSWIIDSNGNLEVSKRLSYCFRWVTEKTNQ